MFSRRLTVKSSTENLIEIRNFLSGIADELSLPKDLVDKIILSVDEACTNIIKHAYGSSPSEDININVKYFKDKLEVTIVDSGIHFDPSSVPPPDLKKYVKERKHGGLGMFLMKELMDKVKYSALPGGQNQLKLIKYI
ncbi:MAG: ATP-binding protein [Chlorobi bacterium]|nr:ATP-binding protein [Chlorobiota bacterium]